MALTDYQTTRRHFNREAGIAAAETYLMEQRLRKVGEKRFVQTLKRVCAYSRSTRSGLVIGPLGRPLTVFEPGTL